MDEAELLEMVKEAYKVKRQAQKNARALVLRARKAGISHDRIAQAAGVSRPAIIDTEKRARG